MILIWQKCVFSQNFKYQTSPALLRWDSGDDFLNYKVMFKNLKVRVFPVVKIGIISFLLLNFLKIFCIRNLAPNKRKLNYQIERKKIADLKKYSSFFKKIDPLKFADFALLPP